MDSHIANGAGALDMTTVGVGNAALPATAAATAVAKRWLVNPYIDLLFCCGGAVWIAALSYDWATREYSNEFTMSFAVVLTLLTHSLANPHTSATWLRIYGDPAENKRFRFYSVWLAIGMVALGAFALTQPGWPAAFANLYLLWVILHYTSQVYGIALLYCVRWGYRFAPWEKNVFKYTLIFTALFAIARKLAWREYAIPQFLGLPMPFWGPIPDWIAYISGALWAASTLLFVFIVVDKFFREGAVLPAPVVLLLISIGVFILATGPLMYAVWLFVPAFFHGSQYLMVSGVYHFGKKRQDDASFTAKLFSWEGVKYWAVLVIIGNFIYAGAPTFLSELGVSYVAGLAVIFSVVNFHHFLTDAAIWKLRDPKTREVLLNG